MLHAAIVRLSRLFTSLDRRYKQFLLLSVDVFGVVIAYVFTLAVQDHVEIVPKLRDSGLLILPVADGNYRRHGHASAAAEHPAEIL